MAHDLAAYGVGHIAAGRVAHVPTPVLRADALPVAHVDAHIIVKATVWKRGVACRRTAGKQGALATPPSTGGLYTRRDHSSWLRRRQC